MVMVNFQGLLCWGCMGSGFPYCSHAKAPVCVRRTGRQRRWC